MIVNKTCHCIPWVSTLKNMGYIFLKTYCGLKIGDLPLRVF